MKTTDPDFDLFLAGHGVARAEFDIAVECATQAYRQVRVEQAKLDRLAWSGPDRAQRQIARTFRIKPKLLGIGSPALAIDGHAYRRRQKNRVKRRRK